MQDSDRDLPMLAVYEAIDLGLVSTLGQRSSHSCSSLLDLLQGNHPVFLPDPIHEDAVYVYHAFGVHALHLGALLQSLAVGLREVENDGGASLSAAIQRASGSSVKPILNSYSVERQSVDPLQIPSRPSCIFRCSNPIIGVAIPNDVYLTYSIFILTSAMRITSFGLNLRSDSPRPRTQALPSTVDKAQLHPRLIPVGGPTPYISVLGTEQFVPPPILSQPFSHRLALGSQNAKGEFMLTPDTLRYVGSTVEAFTAQIRDIQLAHGISEARLELQQHELRRQQEKCYEMMETIERLRVKRSPVTQQRLKAAHDDQKIILARLNRMLNSLMQKASPELSEHETRWFQELKRMKVDIMGAARSDEGALVSRITLVRPLFLEHGILLIVLLA
jgi:nucleoporin NUP82